MTITKFGHCCLLLEIEGKRILVDPGRFSSEQNALVGIDIILITHEHADHYHSESIEAILANNPEATVITNSSVAKLLAGLGVTAKIIEGRTTEQVAGVALAAYDGVHEEIFEEFGLVQNTGYMVANEFFFPGDAYTVPDKAIKILALPVAGPWCKVSDAINYGIRVAPTTALPVHDATLNEVGQAVTYPHLERELKKAGINFVVPTIGQPMEL